MRGLDNGIDYNRPGIPVIGGVPPAGVPSNQVAGNRVTGDPRADHAASSLGQAPIGPGVERRASTAARRTRDRMRIKRY